jgi:hypothetical protein
VVERAGTVRRKARITGGVLLIVLAVFVLVVGAGIIVIGGDLSNGIAIVFGWGMLWVGALFGWAGWRLARARGFANG